MLLTRAPVIGLRRHCYRDDHTSESPVIRAELQGAVQVMGGTKGS